MTFIGEQLHSRINFLSDQPSLVCASSNHHPQLLNIGSSALGTANRQLLASLRVSKILNVRMFSTFSANKFSCEF
jgi:hypothetical protein